MIETSEYEYLNFNKRFNLSIIYLIFNKDIRLICFNCPTAIDNRQFLLEFVVLPLSDIIIVLGIDWVSSFNQLYEIRLCQTNANNYKQKCIPRMSKLSVVRDFSSTNYMKLDCAKPMQTIISKNVYLE